MRRDFRGEKFFIQPALNYNGSLDAPGYSFPYIGGNSTYVIIHCDRRPKALIVTDIDDGRLARAASMLSPELASQNRITLTYLNTAKTDNPIETLQTHSGGRGYDDVLVFAPVTALIEQADQILGRDGCLNFFAGPSDPNFMARLNFYNIHYASTHIVGTSGGNTDDLIDALDMIGKGLLNPAILITHVGGLDSVIDATLRLPELPGGKKLIYNEIKMPHTGLYQRKRLRISLPIPKKYHGTLDAPIPSARDRRRGEFSAIS